MKLVSDGSTDWLYQAEDMAVKFEIEARNWSKEELEILRAIANKSVGGTFPENALTIKDVLEFATIIATFFRNSKDMNDFVSRSLKRAIVRHQNKPMEADLTAPFVVGPLHGAEIAIEGYRLLVNRAWELRDGQIRMALISKTPEQRESATALRDKIIREGVPLDV